MRNFFNTSTLVLCVNKITEELNQISQSETGENKQQNQIIVWPQIQVKSKEYRAQWQKRCK